MIKLLREVYEYREVLMNLIVTTIKLRYKRSVLGFFWSFLSPLLTMTVMAIVFSMLFRFNIENYALYIFSGLLPWNFILMTVSNGTLSLVQADGYLNKIYLPKLIFPFQVIGAELVNFVLSMLVLFCMGFFIGAKIQIGIVLLPLAIINMLLFSTALCTLTAIAAVYFKDMTHIVAILMNALFYVCPVIYDLGMVPAKFHQIFRLNPILHILEIFRTAIYGSPFPPIENMIFITVLSFLFFCLGVLTMKKFDKDIIYRL